MKVLFIGGTGIISTASTRLAAERGIELTLLRRGQRSAEVRKNVGTITADMTDEAATAKALGNQTFDAVVDWIVQTSADVERDIRLFRDRTRQYIFISSASAYQRPVGHYLITESTPLANPFWQYSVDSVCRRDRRSCCLVLDVNLPVAKGGSFL
jgi:nucleoside-diphosphate-sugar epimerase